MLQWQMFDVCRNNEKWPAVKLAVNNATLDVIRTSVYNKIWLKKKLQVEGNEFIKFSKRHAVLAVVIVVVVAQASRGNNQHSAFVLFHQLCPWFINASLAVLWNNYRSSGNRGATCPSASFAAFVITAPSPLSPPDKTCQYHEVRQVPAVTDRHVATIRAQPNAHAL